MVKLSGLVTDLVKSKSKGVIENEFIINMIGYGQNTGLISKSKGVISGLIILSQTIYKMEDILDRQLIIGILLPTKFPNFTLILKETGPVIEQHLDHVPIFFFTRNLMKTKITAAKLNKR